MATYKITQDDRCPITRPYGVVDDGGELESCHPSRVEAQGAIAKLNASGDEPETPGAPTDMPMHRASDGDGSKPYGDVAYADPGYQKDGKKRYPIDTEAHTRAAWSYINQAGNASAYSAEQLANIKGRIKAAAKRFGIEIADNSSSSQRAAPAPVEERAAKLSSVDFGERTLTLVAVPYEQHTPVEYRGEVWREVFSRTAFNGFEPARRRVPVSAVLRAPAFDHNDGHLVGKVINVYPEEAEGLVLDVRISSTPAGDETLQLAHDDALSPSVGFVARGGDHVLDRRTMTRRINRAFLDHLSMVPTPAYEGARVLAMRDQGPMVSARDLPRLDTPALDDYLSDPLTQWANERLGKPGTGGW